MRQEFYYCVIDKRYFCLWSLATNRAECWRLFENGCHVTRAKAKRDGLYCAKVRITIEE